MREENGIGGSTFFVSPLESNAMNREGQFCQLPLSEVDSFAARRVIAKTNQTRLNYF